MANRNRIDPHHVSQMRTTLSDVLKHSPNYLKCPLMDSEMLAVWEDGFPKEILNALNLLSLHEYFSAHQHTEKIVTFIVPDHQSGAASCNMPMAIRFSLENAENHKQYFTDLPAKGPHRLPMYGNSGSTVKWRALRREEIDKVLTPARSNEFWEWAMAAAACAERQLEARKTIHDVTEMLSTAGQLRRMVPDLINYLPRHMQMQLEEQKRASPFPDEWATYPKDRIERMTAALAEGHLLSGMAKQNASGNAFSWAQYAPRNWTGIPYQG